MSQDDPELDELLSRCRPEPTSSCIADMEQRLIPHRQGKAIWWRLPQVRLGAIAAAGLASVILAFSLAGLGPFAGETQSVRAKTDCKQVLATRVERIPAVVTNPDGTTTVESRRQAVRRFERRCR